MNQAAVLTFGIRFSWKFEISSAAKARFLESDIMGSTRGGLTSYWTVSISIMKEEAIQENRITASFRTDTSTATDRDL
jgi:hypothetical protein